MSAYTFCKHLFQPCGTDRATFDSPRNGKSWLEGDHGCMRMRLNSQHMAAYRLADNVVCDAIHFPLMLDVRESTSITGVEMVTRLFLDSTPNLPTTEAELYGSPFPHQQLCLHTVVQSSQLCPTINGGWLNQSSSLLSSLSSFCSPSLGDFCLLSSLSFVSFLE